MKKSIIIWIIVILVIIEFFIIIAPGDVKLVDTNTKVTPVQKTKDLGLEIKDLKEGTGKAVKPGDTVVMHYRGTLKNGTEFDNSYKRNQPLETTIGTGQVIKGWDEGIPGMKTGGIRQLIIPPQLGYGDQGNPPLIPPNATLIFEVELLSIK